MTESPYQQLSAEEKQAILAAIVNTSDDAIISKTLQGIITSWNQTAVKMFGYTEYEAVGSHISMIIPKQRLSEEEMIIGRIAAGKRVDHFETVRLTKNGGEIPLSISVSPIIDASGVVVGASKIARDIRDRKLAESRQAILASIVDNSEDTILSKTLDGVITSWNRAAEKMFGYTEDEIIGKNISTIIPKTRLHEEDYIIGEIKQGRRIDHFETRRLTKEGREVPLSVSVSPVLDNHGNIIGASKIARDITEQIAAKEHASKLYEEIKALNEKKDEFIGLASHELKTPLTTLSGYLQILGRMIKDDKGAPFINKTLSQLNKLTSLVNDLLDVSKIEAGKLQLGKERFDIIPILYDAAELIENSSDHHKIVIESDFDRLEVNADPQRIEQVVVNLLSNAVKYSPKSNQVIVILKKEADSLAVGIRDSGFGIEASKVANIFTRFYRAEDSNPNISGLGIGLFLSHEIISRHQGSIWVDTEFGRGSTFWFTLPL